MFITFNIKFSVLKDLLTDVVLGHDFLDQHKSVNIHFGGTEPPLNLGALKPLKAFQPPALFKYLSENCHLIATKSRRYSSTEKQFISQETQKLLSENIIERSDSS